MRLRRTAVFCFAVLAPLSVMSNAVSATVSVNPTTAAGGVSTDLTFTVGNVTQSPTKKVTVTFPSDPLVASADAQGPTGWTSTVYAETGTVSSVIFSAGSIAPGATGDFTITFTPANGDAVMHFNVQQSYANGTSTTAETGTVQIKANAAVTSTTSKPSSTTSATFATTTTVKKSGSGSGDSVKTVGQVLVAVGVAVGLTMYLRIRRVKRK